METSRATNDAFRILALDGGGIKGTYTASVLAKLEEMSGKPIAPHFDLITGTSTGGIIAIALGLGVAPERILRLYADKGPAIFPRATWWHRHVRPYFRVKHSRAVLEQELAAVFGDRLLGDSSCRLVIPAFNAHSGKLHLFKTRHLAKYAQDHLERATDVALSTAAAPTYFSAYTTPNGGCYVDGGLWANCPALVGIFEATCILGKTPECIRVLSIGTTTEPYSIGMAQRDGGKLAWAADAPPLFIRAQVGATVGMGELLLGGRFRRIDETVEPNRFSLDSTKGIAELRALGERSARLNAEMVIREFLYAHADPFRPCEPTREVAQ